MLAAALEAVVLAADPAQDLAPFGVAFGSATFASVCAYGIKRLIDGRLVNRDVDQVEKDRTDEAATLAELVRQSHKREAEYLKFLRDERRT